MSDKDSLIGFWLILLLAIDVDRWISIVSQLCGKSLTTIKETVQYLGEDLSPVSLRLVTSCLSSIVQLESDSVILYRILIALFNHFPECAR